MAAIERKKKKNWQRKRGLNGSNVMFSAPGVISVLPLTAVNYALEDTKSVKVLSLTNK